MIDLSKVTIEQSKPDEFSNVSSNMDICNFYLYTVSVQ